MKIKVGNKIYDGDKEPVMVILSDLEKQQIAQMAPDATMFCSYPSTEEWTKDNFKKIRDWMKV